MITTCGGYNNALTLTINFVALLCCTVRQFIGFTELYNKIVLQDSRVFILVGWERSSIHHLPFPINSICKGRLTSQSFIYRVVYSPNKSRFLCHDFNG